MRIMFLTKYDDYEVGMFFSNGTAHRYEVLEKRNGRLKLRDNDSITVDWTPYEHPSYFFVVSPEVTPRGYKYNSSKDACPFPYSSSKYWKIERKIKAMREKRKGLGYAF
jgi:hypothetical protein